MKEMEIRAQFAGEGLTKPVNPFTLDERGSRLYRGGSIFMAEQGKGEDLPQQPEPKPEVSPQAEIPQEQSTRQVSAERIERARQAWESLNVGRVLSVDERRTQEDAIKMGIPPVGGADGEATQDSAPEGATPSGNKEDGSEDREEEEEYLKAAKKILSDEEVIRVMTSENPDFNSLPQLEKFINRYMDPADSRAMIVHFAKSITSKDNGFSEVSKKVAFERLLEKIISMADATPDSPYSSYVGSWYVSSNIQGLLGVARANLPEYYAYFGDLKYVREVAHELNRNLKYGEQYKKYVTESLRTGGLNFMHNNIVGVNAVIREYERVSSNMVRQVKNWFSEKEVKAIDREVNDIIKNSAGDIRTKEGRSLTQWEIDRALIIGKVLFSGSQRMAMYAGIGDIPSGTNVTGRIGSLAYEYIVRTLFPFKTIAPRFFAAAGGPRRLMERIFNEQKTQLEEEGTLLFPIFGLDERTILMDSYGALDSQTHSWRSEMMFFGAIQMEINGKKINLLEYLNRFALKHGENSKDPILGGKGVPQEAKTAFSADVRETVLGQRLYLSILAKYGNFDNSLKTDIWKKISLLTPSTIASVAPNAISSADEQTWKQMRHKLYAAENRRINDDAGSYRNGLTNDILQAESTAYKDILRIAGKGSWTNDDFNSILSYMGMTDIELDADEKKLLEKIIRAGLGEASELAKAKLPFTFAIVDAPEVAWAKTPDGAGGLGDEDLLRILLSDQDNFSKAWNEINGLIENPTAGLREHLKNAVDGIGNVIGREAAQKVTAPFIVAYIKMASTFPVSEWIGDFQKLSRQPTSEMERYYRNSHISWEAKEREIVLEGISQDGSISDDISEGKVSDLDMVKKKTKSDRKAVFYRMARLILMLLGPEMGMQFLKILLPPDMLNSLQKK